MNKVFLALAFVLLALTATAQDPIQMAKSDKLFEQGVELYNAGKYQEAIPFFEQSEHIDIVQLPEGHARRDYSSHWLASCYYKLGNREKAQQTFTFFLAEPIDRRLTIKSDSLNAIVSMLLENGDIAQARQIIGQCAEMERKNIGTNNLFYANSNLICAMCDNMLGNHNLAAQEAKMADDIYNYIFAEDNVIYAQFLKDIAVFYGENGQEEEALETIWKAISILGEDEDLLNMLSVYSKQFNDQATFQLKIFEGKLKSTPINSIDRANILINLSSLYTILGNVKRTDECRKETNDILNYVSNREITDIDTLILISELYYNNLNYIKALEQAVKAIKIGDKDSVKNKDNLILANSIAAYSNYSIFSNQDTSNPDIKLKLYETLKYTSKVIELTKEDFNQQPPKYIDENINNIDLITGIYLLTNEPVKALQAAKDHYLLVKKYRQDEEMDIADALFNIANAYSEMGDSINACDYYDKFLDIEKKIYGENSIHYSRDLVLTTMTLFNNGFYDSSIKYVKPTNEATVRAVLSSFSHLTSAEREAMWSLYNGWFNILTMFPSTYYNQELINYTYDGALFSKGLLLGVEQEIRNLLMDNNNPKVRNLYNEYKFNLATLEKYRANNKNDSVLNTLNNVIYKQEKQLLEISGAEEVFNKKFKITWKQVQNALGNNDVAVEFILCGFDDIKIYYAFVLKKDMDSPIMFPLFEEKQLKAKMSQSKNAKAPSEIYKPEKMVSELIWKSLAQYLDGAEHVYFAPSGELYSIAIESLPDWENSGRLMSDRWPGLCRLSSTREIAINHGEHPKTEIMSLVAYGGLKYGGIQKDEYGQPIYAVWQDMDTITLTEVKNICSSFETTGHLPTLFEGEHGTEASFKALSGQHKNMIFLSTHGFFWNIDEATKHRNEHTLQFISLGDEKRSQSVEDVSLTHSGLLFSGANYAWQGNELPEGVDDGFLTAKEISQLDLRGLELVVLSACQTGLGDVSGEGVFGLQRGFKKAGAQSILMSLWEVNAYSTKLLMTEFCKNVFEKKMPKRDALRAAQEAVKNFTGDPQSLATKSIKIGVGGITKEQKNNTPTKQTSGDNHPFAHPYYWAGFILLDALD